MVFTSSELSPCGPNQVSEVVAGQVRDRVVDPLDLGLERSAPDTLRGGGPEENAREIRAIFAGEERGPKRDAVLLNAAGGIAAAGHAHDLGEGLVAARDALDSGAAAARLDELARFSRGSS